MIVGGESGHRARPMHPDWARSLRDECRQLKIAFFFKQFGTWGSPVPDKNRKTIGLMPDGREVPVGTTGAATLARLGKKLAGERLDDRLHQQFPQARQHSPRQGSLPLGGPVKKAA
jgi:hypothetical protein